MEKKTPVNVIKGKKILTGTFNKKKFNYVAGEILIAIKDEHLKKMKKNDKLLKQALLNKLPKGTKIIHDINKVGVLKIEVSENINVIALVETLKKNPIVKDAEPNIIFETCQRIPNEYATMNALRGAQWGLERIRAPWAWNNTTGNQNVVIAVIDSGIAGPERTANAVYRWFNPSNGDHFYCTDPLGELAHGGGYRYEGSPFRLYALNAQNTTPFYRWYNPSNGDHFYCTDPNGELAPQSGYGAEGTIGNIATVAIPGSVALYRWFNPSSGDHFYCTDPNGELAPQSGYHSEGIAGYVDPTMQNHLSHPDIGNAGRFILGNDYIHDDNFPIDDLGHGTHVAGIASADTNNNNGIAGVCWSCSVLVIKIFEPLRLPGGTVTGQATAADLANAIIEAVDYGLNHNLKVVINYSGRSTVPSTAVEEAIKYALREGGLVIAATGNDSDHARINPVTGAPNPLRASVGWPAAYSSQYNNVIAVGAIDNNNNLANFSNVGPEVNVTAPGVNVRSTLPNYATGQNPAANQYGNWAGTSMATPHVAGLAALMYSINPGLTPRRVREIIETTAEDLGNQGKDNNFGHGRINCERAILLLTGGAIFRWFNPSNGDHFYCTDPNGELAPQSGYLYEGSPFRLFPLATQNTTPFYRWYNPSTGDHFYCTDPNGELAPQSGYGAEGTIGNIATVAIPGSVALYRWFNPSSGDHFYCTDPNGELSPQSGYHTEGISGYVMLTL